MKFSNLLRELLEPLKTSPAENPVRELRLLVAHALNLSYEHMLFNPPLEISEATAQIIKQLVERRCQHEPLAKILGQKEFWGLNFRVTTDTLDPRPESELLVEAALKYILDPQKPLSLLDLGTGSGCLLLSLLSELPKAHGRGVDFSAAALKVAQENARNLGLVDRSHFIQSDWFEKIEGRFDIILANPPYIDRTEQLSRQTLYDPEIALFAEEDGLAAYKAILKSARQYLKPAGMIIFEIGYTQAEAVINIAQENKLNFISRMKDFNQLDRCLVFS